MSYLDAIDSYLQYVKARLLLIPTVQAAITAGVKRIAGYMDAQDWPNKNVIFDTFYLLDLGDVPVGRTFYSAQTPVLFRQVQWVWVNKGTDLTQGVRQANRGDRFRTMEIMKGELLNASFPGFCLKQTWALVNGTWTGTPSPTNEQILWKPIEFHTKPDKASGIIYGTAMTRLVDMTDPILT